MSMAYFMHVVDSRSDLFEPIPGLDLRHSIVLRNVRKLKPGYIQKIKQLLTKSPPFPYSIQR